LPRPLRYKFTTITLILLFIILVFLWFNIIALEGISKTFQRELWLIMCGLTMIIPPLILIATIYLDRTILKKGRGKG